MKKRITALLCILLMCGTACVHAQWNIGIKGGVVLTGVRDKKDCSVKRLTAGNGGVLLSYTLCDRLEIQGEALLAGKSLKIKKCGIENSCRGKYKATYLDLPLLAKIYLTDGLNVQVGPQVGILLHEACGEDAAALKRRNAVWSAVAGAGYDFRCNVFVDIRYELGLTPDFKGRSGFRNSNLMAEAGYILHF